MIDEYKERRRATLEAQRKAIDDEEEHLRRLRKVFGGTEEGYAVLDWLLSDVCGFWCSGVAALDAAGVGAYDAGRRIFHAVTMADVDLASRLLAERSAAAEASRIKERRALESAEKEID